jgi:hypothetical protein
LHASLPANSSSEIVTRRRKKKSPGASRGKALEVRGDYYNR